MAEFSSEFITVSNWAMQPDFSILSIYKKLKDGEEIHRVCEGFGITKIKKQNSICFVFVLTNGKFESFEEFLIRFRITGNLNL